MAATRTVDFYFDVSCPFCWITSRWIKEVEQVRDIRVAWHPMSLSVLNDGRDYLPEDYKKKMVANWAPARVSAKIANEHPEALDAWYTTIGTKIHTDGRARTSDEDGYDELIAETLAEIGLPADYAAIAHTTDLDDDLRAYHAEAMKEVGDDVGTPVVKLGDVAFFGPVLTRIPRGEEAGTLFDAAYALAAYPHFFEIKRSRTENPHFD